MGRKIFLIAFMILVASTMVGAARPSDFLYGRHPQLVVTITPEKTELYPGEIATFTISIRNRSTKTFKLDYSTGQQWDLAVFHNNLQLYRWSEGLFWAHRDYSIHLKSGEVKSHQLSWRTTDKLGRPFPQGTYHVRGMATLSPKWLVTEDCKITVVPPKVTPKETIKARLNMLFDIELPRYIGPAEITWHIQYKHNRNRLEVRKVAKVDGRVVVTFEPKRYGHVEFDIYGFHENKNIEESIERLTYRVEIGDKL